MTFNHTKIEKKWQKAWEEAQCFKVELDKSKPKFYALDMFPYPSGKGLHVGHLASYTPTDIVARFKRAKGFNVLHPMGYDSFGLPAEQYAIKTGVHPAETTDKAIQSFRNTLKTLGYSFDWSRELSTCDPKFYKWTQFIFLKLFEKGLAYQKEVPVNWCPALRTVLANEEVVNGRSERGDHPVVRLPMKQWMLKITSYAERLISDLDELDWPEKTKEAQRYWIGKSVGASVQFQVDGHSDKTIEVFTTRPDTLYGATFMVLAPEHPFAKEISTKEQMSKVNLYIDQAQKKSEIDRKASTDKTGVFTGSYAVNPVSGEKIPIWLADYVLMDYGTGAIMAVPGHDQRDFDFASHFGLPIQRVLESQEPLPFEGEGTLVNSGFLNGHQKTFAIEKMIEHLEKNKIGKRQINYKLRDWLFSRQRYWGEPFPIVKYKNGELKSIPESELPVLLPNVPDYQPSEEGEPPLARNKEFMNYFNSLTKEEGSRIADTMPGSAGSSWYFLRYCDPKNDQEAFSFEAQDYWMPVDLYVGGPEHTVGHLLYARFWQKVLFDIGLVSHKEPFQKLAHQGTVMGPDGYRMSKSRGNVINPDEIQKEFGADAARMYISFIGPFDKDKPWDPNGIEGIRRFLERVWRLIYDENGNLVVEETEEVSENILRSYHKTIKKVTEDIERLSFNTAISAMMILINDLYKEKVKPKFILKTLSQLMMPFAPHISEEIWQSLGGSGLVSTAAWPEYSNDLAKDDQLEMGVQVNGKMRGTIQVNLETTEVEAISLAKNSTSFLNAIENKTVVKVIYKPGKILNLIVK
ncbi:MAG: leucine--tRNA ligase [Bdellovibrionaceae bacterium]|nr:leucine--tRNA ligase [Pseudobdellovibrionaceae bacterium]